MNRASSKLFSFACTASSNHGCCIIILSDLPVTPVVSWTKFIVFRGGMSNFCHVKKIDESIGFVARKEIQVYVSPDNIRSTNGINRFPWEKCHDPKKGLWISRSCDNAELYTWELHKSLGCISIKSFPEIEPNTRIVPNFFHLLSMVMNEIKKGNENGGLTMLT